MGWYGSFGEARRVETVPAAALARVAALQTNPNSLSERLTAEAGHEELGVGEKGGEPPFFYLVVSVSGSFDLTLFHETADLWAYLSNDLLYGGGAAIDTATSV